MSSQPIAGGVPPGSIIRREMEARGWSQTDLAEILGRPIQVVNQILMGKKSITPATARELEEAMEVSAETWLNLEALYRLSLESERDDTVAKRSRLFSRAPVADMRRRGWVSDTRDIGVLTHEVMRNLRIKSLDDLPQLQFAARKSTSYDDVPPEQEAWCCRALQIAEELEGIPKFSQKRFEAGLGAVRGMGRSPDTIREIPGALRDIGVRFIVVEHLPKTKIDGATFWLNKSSPVVVLSLRYSRIDHFLFTLFHELMHVRHQDAISIDSDILDEGDGEQKPDCETRANSEAGALLVPPERLARLISKTSSPGKGEIVRFAAEIGIHAGVVVGQLQYRGVVSWSACRELLVPVRDSIIETAVTDGWGKRT